MRGLFGVSITVAWFALTGCQPENQFVAPPPPEVTVSQPVTRSIAETLEFTATTRATARVDVRARVNGYLQRIAFEDGAMVKEGDLLFVIEPDPFQAELDAAEARLQKATAEEQLAVTNLERTQRLRDQNASTMQQVDIEESAQLAAVAEVAIAKAALRQAELNLAYTEIRAPISGRIGRHLVDVGNLVQSQQTPLAMIESLDPIHAYYHIGESDLLRFMEMNRAGRITDPRTDPAKVELGLANEDDFPHTGYVDYQDLGLDPGTGTLQQRAVIPNPDGRLVPGLFVRMRAQLGAPEPRLLVEERALGSDQRGDFALVVNDKNVVEYRPVKLGIADGKYRVILDGIQSGDWVVVNGLQRARPGAPVNPQRDIPAAETAEAKAEPAADGGAEVTTREAGK